MLTFLAILALPPLAAWMILRRLVPTTGWRGEVLPIVLLAAVGAGISSPFLTNRAHGTGEAYNYCLALADATVQMRAGEIPPLVGQTEFAFNGRIHPLRTAPYLFYLARGVDVLTGERLDFWTLQNLTLAFSLMAAVQVAYLGLRWGAGCPRLAAFALAAVFGCCPALLTASYFFELFMTVHAVPFVVLAVAACWRQSREFHWRADVVLAAAVAGAWLAHPPVAMWTSASVGLLRLLFFLRRASWRESGTLLGAALLAAWLGGFVLASTLTLPDVGTGNVGGAMTTSRDAIEGILRGAFPGMLLPVPDLKNNLSNLQLGYSLWLALALAVSGLFWRGSRPTPAVAVAVILGLLAFLIPVPFLNRWLWNIVPNSVITLSSIWPMQRIYLVAAALVIFAAAAPLSTLLAGNRRRLLLGVLGFAVTWSLAQTWPLLQRGFSGRQTEDATRRSHLASNIDLTATSYAYLNVPPWFVYGVMDPRDEFRLITIPSSMLPEPAPVLPMPIASGRLAWPESAESGPIQLEPGKRYVIDFKFRTARVAGEIVLMGSSLSRHYTLPEAGPMRGFGMDPEHQHTLSVWTVEPAGEVIRLRFTSLTPETPVEVADYSVRVVDASRSPVTVQSVFPLRCKVVSPDATHFLETCRRYLPGYEATVNGEPASTARSPGGQLMVSVPAGRSLVEVRYRGAPLVRQAFVASATGWALLLGVALAGGMGLTPARSRAAWDWLGRHKAVPISLVVLLVAWLAGSRALEAWRKEHATGAVRVQFRLPPVDAVVGRTEPLVVTGRPNAGDFAFVRYLDATHVQFGVDHWGVSGEDSNRVELDNTEPHTLEVRFASFYPDVPADDERRKTMVLLLDGREILRTPLGAHPTTNREISIGRNPIGGSTVAEKFSGDILAVERVRPAKP